jgi:hypothetical protein
MANARRPPIAFRGRFIAYWIERGDEIGQPYANAEEAYILAYMRAIHVYV